MRFFGEALGNSYCNLWLETTFSLAKSFTNLFILHFHFLFLFVFRFLFFIFRYPYISINFKIIQYNCSILCCFLYNKATFQSVIFYTKYVVKNATFWTIFFILPDHKHPSDPSAFNRSPKQKPPLKLIHRYLQITTHHNHYITLTIVHKSLVEKSKKISKIVQKIHWHKRFSALL